MRCGHADAQFMFERMGKQLGYKTRRTWTRELPTDGVWLLQGSGLLLPEVPAIALEVAVSEGPKAIKGSMDILAEVSPALGILVINDVEIRRGELRRGTPAEVVTRRIEGSMAAALDRSTRHQQRIEVWSYGQLQQKYRLITGDQGPATLARLVG